MIYLLKAKFILILLLSMDSLASNYKEIEDNINDLTIRFSIEERCKTELRCFSFKITNNKKDQRKIKYSNRIQDSFLLYVVDKDKRPFTQLNEILSARHARPDGHTELEVTKNSYDLIGEKEWKFDSSNYFVGENFNFKELEYGATFFLIINKMYIVEGEEEKPIRVELYVTEK